MTKVRATSNHERSVTWVRGGTGDLAEPLVETAPYVELKLEHPDLEPTHFGDSFFPDAVPYDSGGVDRVFYWRDALAAKPHPTEAWTGICATPTEVQPLVHESRYQPPLVNATDDGHEVIVDGVVAGDSTTASIQEYVPPDVTVRHVTPDAVELELPTSDELIPTDTRRRVELPEQTVQTERGDCVTTTPELLVRYPGHRQLFHPAPDADYYLFPSFGLDLDRVPNPLPVPTTSGELDHEALAVQLHVALDSSPYPLRVLWQAFAYTAFDPHSDDTTKLGQFPSGELTVQSS